MLIIVYPQKKNANHSGCKLSHWSTVGLGSSQTGRASRWGSKLGHGRAMEKNRRDRGKKALDAAFHGQGQQQSLSSVSVCGKGIRIRSDFFVFFFNLSSSPDDGKLHIRIAACRLHCALCSTPRAGHGDRSSFWRKGTAQQTKWILCAGTSELVVAWGSALPGCSGLWACEPCAES